MKARSEWDEWDSGRERNRICIWILLLASVNQWEINPNTNGANNNKTEGNFMNIKSTLLAVIILVAGNLASAERSAFVCKTNEGDQYSCSFDSGEQRPFCNCSIRGADGGVSRGHTCVEDSTAVRKYIKDLRRVCH